eukprot:Em0001g2592a
MGIVTFTAFCKQLHLQPCPASKQAATLFAAHQEHRHKEPQGRQPLTIKMLKELSQSLYATKTHFTHDRLMVQAVAFFSFQRAKPELCSIIPLPVWQATVSPKATVHPPFSVVPEQLRLREL